jgi:hypothetical protein
VKVNLQRRNIIRSHSHIVKCIFFSVIVKITIRFRFNGVFHCYVRECALESVSVRMHVCSIYSMEK